MHLQSGHTYKIINVKGGTALDLSGGDNKSIIGYQYHDSPNQKWIFEFDNDGGWVIQNEGCSGKYLAVEQRPHNGVKLVAADEPFTWEVKAEHSSDGHYRLFVPDTHFNVDLSDHGNSADGTPIELWGKWDGQNQIWKIESA